MNIDTTYVTSAGAPSTEGVGGGGGLGNRVNAAVMAAVLQAGLAARKASIQQEVAQYGAVGRIFNVTI